MRGDQEGKTMFSKWLERVSECTSPLALTCIFVSVLGPSIILLYTDTYNIWFHGVFLAVVVVCYGVLLLHAAGLKARLARRDREDPLAGAPQAPKNGQSRRSRVIGVVKRHSASL